MRKVMILFIAAACCVVFATAVSAQECGDADGNGRLTMADPVAIISHIAMSGASLNESVADCDGHAGITVGDAQALFRDFYYDEHVLDCSASESYSFAPAPNDTVFLPYMTGIYESIDSIALAIRVYWEEGTNSMYLPLSADTAAWGGYFYPQILLQSAGTVVALNGDDAWIAVVNEYDPYTQIVGYNSVVTLIMRRIKPGTASIQCEPVVINELWRPSVGKIDGDLLVPEIRTYAVEAPAPHVTVSPTALNLVARTGAAGSNAESITFESDLGPVSFTLLTSDDWLVIQDYQAGGYTTPATITVKGDATALAPGNYTGTITVEDVEPTNAEFTAMTIDVNFEVLEPMVFPHGDVNCDGVVSIGDISKLIDHLYLSQDPLVPCE